MTLKASLDNITKSNDDIQPSECWDMIQEKFLEVAQKNKVTSKISIAFERIMGGTNVFVYVDNYLLEKFESEFTMNDACLAKHEAKDNGIKYLSFDGLHPRVKFIYNK